MASATATRRARPTDDHAELDLEVERVRALGPDDRFAIGDDRVGELGEEHRPRGRLPSALRRMRAVVEPDAHDLAGLAQDRDGGHVGAGDAAGAGQDLELALDIGLPLVGAEQQVQRPGQRDEAIAQVDGERVEALVVGIGVQAHRRQLALGDGAAEPLGLGLGAVVGLAVGVALGDALGAAEPEADGLGLTRFSGQKSSGLVRSP